MMNIKTTGMIHSKSAQGNITVIDKPNPSENDYIVITEGGVKCHAIFNPFSGLYYADDIYAIIN